MKTFLLQAPRDFVDAGIPKRYMIQVIFNTKSRFRNVKDIEVALMRTDFGKLNS